MSIIDLDALRAALNSVGYLEYLEGGTLPPEWAVLVDDAIPALGALLADAERAAEARGAARVVAVALSHIEAAIAKENQGYRNAAYDALFDLRTALRESGGES